MGKFESGLSQTFAQGVAEGAAHHSVGIVIFAVLGETPVQTALVVTVGDRHLPPPADLCTRVDVAAGHLGTSHRGSQTLQEVVLAVGSLHDASLRRTE
jgi:hypothetical protein